MVEKAERIKLRQAILVEGKYDKLKLEQFVDAHIFTTDGFRLFSLSEKAVMLRKIAEKQGLIVLTDSDPAGFVIRNKLKGMLPRDKVIHLYAPALAGKERRKKAPSKARILGVEGLSVASLKRLFERSGIAIGDEQSEAVASAYYTKADLYAAGLCGREDSASKREVFCRAHELPPTMTAGALLEAVNLLGIDIE